MQLLCGGIIRQARFAGLPSERKMRARLGGYWRLLLYLMGPRVRRRRRPVGWTGCGTGSSGPTNINIPSAGVPLKLTPTHRAFLARIVEEGAMPAIHGVVRWRACDLIMRLHEEFGILGLG